MSDIAPAAREIIVDANYLRAWGQQPLAQVGTAARDKNSAAGIVSLKRHESPGL
jgi:hypothetical protein